jgi:two-component system phosphate regulon response regulator PhoB
MARPRILVVEDEADLRGLLEYNLRQAGYDVFSRSTGKAGLDAARVERPDLVVLDLMLPEMPGLDVCKALQREPATRGLPILMLTARSAEVDRVLGLELGAEDYVTKPFSVRELLVRVRKILARHGFAETSKEEAPEELRAGPLRVSLDYHRVTVDGSEVPLTATEIRLLAHLIRSGGRVQTRTRLLDEVWEDAGDVTERTVDTFVKRLRAKLGPAGDLIETVRGVGYKLREP